MRFTNIILSFIAIFYLNVAFAESANLKNDLDKTILNAINDKRIVGTVVLVKQNGKEVYRGVFGWSDREHRIPMKENTAFRLSSMTKPIVTVAALKLVDEGKLKLNDPVTKWLPHFKPQTVDGKTPTITIWNLLTHTAGLNYNFLESEEGPYHRLGVSDGLEKVNFSLDENIKRIGNAPLLFAPGSAWNYSLATDVLGEVIEKVSGKSLQDTVSQTVLEPLEMHHTGFYVTSDTLIAVPYADHKPEPIRMSDHQRVPFFKSALVFSPSRVFDKNAYPSGGAGMVSNADDYMNFLESIRTGTVPLKKNTLQQLTTNQIGKLNTLLGPGWGWSLAFGILENPQEAKTPQGKGTYTWGGVWGHSWWVDPINNLTVVIMTNTAVEGTNGKFPQEIKNNIYAHCHPLCKFPVISKSLNPASLNKSN